MRVPGLAGLLDIHISGGVYTRNRCTSPAYTNLHQVVYSTLFDYIVKRVNDVSRGPEGSPVIGILDIFGFENLTTNSFEQLCINYVNEMLQEQFNETVFAAERRLLKAEGVEIDDGALQSSATRLGLMG